MAIFRFEQLYFKKNSPVVTVTFVDHYTFDIPEADLTSIGAFKAKNNSICFPGTSEKRASQRLNFLLERGFSELKDLITGNPAVYVHKNSGIPLLGSSYFGIIDRNTSLIEIKPVTGCNLSCIYCSVDQSRRSADFVIEAEYLVLELQRLVSLKAIPVEIHIGCQGEPMLYAQLQELVQKISLIKNVEKISIDTNGTLLSKRFANELLKSGITCFNLSINAFDQILAKKIAGANYSIKHIKDLAIFLGQKNAILITPVLIPGINDSDIEHLVEFSKEHHIPIAIQNFLHYKFGKNPVKQISFDVFYHYLRELEKKYNYKLIYSEQDFNIKKTKKLEKPFKKGDQIDVETLCQGRMPNEILGKAKNRIISIINCTKPCKKVRLIRSKHGIYIGIPA